MKINIFDLMFFIICIASLGIAYLSVIWTNELCKSYCEIQGLEIQYSSIGKCKCKYPDFNITQNRSITVIE